MIIREGEIYRGAFTRESFLIKNINGIDTTIEYQDGTTCSASTEELDQEVFTGELQYIKTIF